MTTLPRQSLAAVATALNVMKVRPLDFRAIGEDEAVVPNS